MDSGAGAACTSTAHLDRYLEPLGFRFNPGAAIVRADALEWLRERPPGPDDQVLICHALEHMERPLDVLRAAGGAGLVAVVVPNPLRNGADCADRSHLYSWTPCALMNIMMRALPQHSITVETIELDLDLMAVAMRRTPPPGRGAAGPG
ncbi:MAG: hypothetical protein RXS42_08500 [Nitrososphaeria archaeon]